MTLIRAKTKISKRHDRNQDKGHDKVNVDRGLSSKVLCKHRLKELLSAQIVHRYQYISKYMADSSRATQIYLWYILLVVKVVQSQVWHWLDTNLHRPSSCGKQSSHFLIGFLQAAIESTMYSEKIIHFISLSWSDVFANPGLPSDIPSALVIRGKHNTDKRYRFLQSLWKKLI